MNCENHIQTIASLNKNSAYCEIKGQVRAKYARRQTRGTNTNMFKFDFMDVSGEIGIAVMNQELCCKFFGLLEVYKFYLIKNFDIKFNLFSTWTEHAFELKFNNDTEVQPCDEEDTQYDLVPIYQVADMKRNATVDIIGVCIHVGDIQKYYNDDAKKYVKHRDLTIVDTSNHLVIVTEYFDVQKYQDVVFNENIKKSVILLKNGIVENRRGFNTINVSRCTVLRINPNTAECDQLRMWYQQQNIIHENHCADEVSDDVTQRNVEITHDLVPISRLSKMKQYAVVNILGICSDIGKLITDISRKTGKEFNRRKLTLIDASNAAVTLTLWDDNAVNFYGHVRSLISLRRGYISEFKGINTIQVDSEESILEINPNTPEGRNLRRAQFGYLTFDEARVLGITFFQIKATLPMIDTANAYYKACPQTNCKVKVRKTTCGDYSCSKCKTTFPNFKFQLLVNMKIADWTSIKDATCFNDQAEKIFERTANEIGEAMYIDPTRAAEFFAPAVYKPYIFTVRNDLYDPWKYIVTAATPMNHKQYNKFLCDNLARFITINNQQ